jgi:Fe-S cluster assembly iron-binding protein IscA
MLEVTDRARATLAGILDQGSSPDGFVLRLIVADGSVELLPSTVESDDVEFSHDGSTVLVLSSEASDHLGDRVLDAFTKDDQIQLTLTRKADD